AKGIAPPAEEMLPAAEVSPSGDLFPSPPPVSSPGEPAYTPDRLVVARKAEAAKAEVEHARYHTISLVSSLDDWIAEARREGALAVTLGTSSPDPMQAEIVGIAMALRPNEACYVPLGHRAADDLLAEGGLAEGQIPAAEVLSRLGPLLEDSGVLKIGH